MTEPEHGLIVEGEYEKEEDAMPPKALVRREPSMWEPSPLATMSDKEFERRLVLIETERSRLQRIQKAIMKEGVDYGKIPGTDKPSLLKPGSEILNKAANLVPTFDPPIRTIGDGETQPTIHYLVHCLLRKYDENGPVQAEGFGSCNSWERKYRWRSGAVCPQCQETLRVSKNKEEWYCWAKTGGCGATFPIDTIDGGQIENSDPYDLDNTFLKMAEKRARIDATVAAHAASGLFTQDAEDLDPDQLANDKPRPQQKPKPSAPVGPLTDENFPHDKPVGFGKHKDRTWGEMFQGDVGGQRDEWLRWLHPRLNLEKPRDRELKPLVEFCLKKLHGEDCLDEQPASTVDEDRAGPKTVKEAYNRWSQKAERMGLDSDRRDHVWQEAFERLHVSSSRDANPAQLQNAWQWLASWIPEEAEGQEGEPDWLDEGEQYRLKEREE